MIENNKIYNWESLEVENSPIIAGLVNSWKNMLNSNLKESDFHKFICDHAFFSEVIIAI